MFVSPLPHGSQISRDAWPITSREVTMGLTHNDVRRMLEIIDAAQNLEEVDLVHNGFRLRVVRGGGANGASQFRSSTELAGVSSPPANPPVSRPPTQTASVIVPVGLVAVRSPMLGTFYRSPSPGEKPFVEVGQRVQANDTVCLIEVMKLFSSIRAGVDGEVVQMLVENGASVELDQPLIFIAPS